MTKFIKIKCLLMSFVLLICAFYIANPIAVAADTVKIGFIFESGVNIREKATTDSKSVAKASEIYVTVTGSQKDAKSTKNPDTSKTYIWYKISYTSSGTTVTGFVREDLITVKEYTLDTDFAKSLGDFPESYHDDLILLHALFPKWTFTADKVPKSFNKSVAAQDYLFYKLVQSSYNSWRSMRKGCYSWSNKKFVETDSGGWYGASREVIAFYMDPRNFLNANDIYQYLSQSFDAETQTIEGIEEIVKDSFLDATITNKKDYYYGKRYSYVIYASGKKAGVNPYVLASTMIQEQGRDGTTLSQGAQYNGKTVYNHFNYGASGSTKSEVLENGTKYAYDQGWDTPSKSIVYGSVKYGSGYISAGQDTYFYKNYNILQPDKLWHQYAQNVADSLNSSKILKTAYAKYQNVALNFRIPVYTSLPSSVSKLPTKSSKLNNYYFDDITAEGLTPSFERYTYDYSLSSDGDVGVTVDLPDGATMTSNSEFPLQKGENVIKLIVKSQTGYKNTYVINVDAQKAGTLFVNNAGNTNNLKVVCGDTNGDNTVTISDLANVRLHLLKLIKLKDNNLKGADTNADGEITISDLANIRLHLLKLITLK